MGWKLPAIEKSDQHSSNVCVQDRDPDSVPERQEGAGRVGAHAGQES